MVTWENLGHAIVYVDRTAEESFTAVFSMWRQRSGMNYRNRQSTYACMIPAYWIVP